MPNNKKLSPDQVESVSAIVKKNTTAVSTDQVVIETNPTAVGEVLTITGLNTGSHSAEWQAPAGGPPSGAAAGDLAGFYPGPMVDRIEGLDVPTPLADRFLKVNAPGSMFEFVPYGTGPNMVAQGNHTHDASAIVTGQIALARGGTAADLSATGGANQFVRQSGIGAPFTVSTLAFGDIPAPVLPIVPTDKGGLGFDASASTGLPFFDVPGVVTMRNAVLNDVVDATETTTFVFPGPHTVSPPDTNALCDTTGGGFTLSINSSYSTRFTGGGVVTITKIAAANTLTIDITGGWTIEGAASIGLAGVASVSIFLPDSGTTGWIVGTTTGGGGAPHALLSATHTDTSAAAPVRGDIIVGTAAPLWARFPIGVVGTYLRSTGLDPAWSGILAADLSGIVALANGGTGANLSATGGAGQYVKQSGVGVAFTVGTIPAGDIPSGISAIKISSGLVDNAEFDRLDGVTSNIQTQLDAKVPQTRTLITTAPLTIDGVGSADLSANRTLAVSSATAAAPGVIQLANHLGGTAAAPTVTGIQETGGPTSLTIGAIATGAILVRSGGSIIGQTGAAPSGAASGDLSGTYPGPKVIAVTDLAATSFPVGTFANGDYVAVSGGSVTGNSKILKTPVRLVEIFPSALAGLGLVDGIALAIGDRVLVTANGAANGIYIVAAGPWTRDVEFDSGADAVTGLLITVENGIRFTGWVWQHVTLPPIVFGVTPLVFRGVSTGADFSVTGGANNFVQQSGTGAVLTVAQPTMAQIVNTATYLKSETIKMQDGTHFTSSGTFQDAAYLVVDPPSVSAGVWTARWNQVSVPATSAEVRIFDNTSAVALFTATITTTGLQSATFSMPVIVSELILQHRKAVGAGSSEIRGTVLYSPV